MPPRLNEETRPYGPILNIFLARIAPVFPENPVCAILQFGGFQMAKLFSGEWMRALSDAWNADREITGKLANAHFHGTIGYGFIDEDRPLGVIIVDSGRVVAAGSYDRQDLSWDLRASPEDWQRWIVNGFGLTNLGTAVALGKLRFVEGDYRSMVRNPTLAGPFLRHFELMARIKTEYR